MFDVEDGALLWGVTYLLEAEWCDGSAAVLMALSNGMDFRTAVEGRIECGCLSRHSPGRRSLINH